MGEWICWTVRPCWTVHLGLCRKVGLCLHHAWYQAGWVSWLHAGGRATWVVPKQPPSGWVHRGLEKKKSRWWHNVFWNVTITIKRLKPKSKPQPTSVFKWWRWNSARRRGKISFNQKCKREQCEQHGRTIFLKGSELNWRPDACCPGLHPGSWANTVPHQVCTWVKGAAFCRPFVYALMPCRIALCSGYLHLLSFLTIVLLYLVGARVKVKWWFGLCLATEALSTVITATK